MVKKFLFIVIFLALNMEVYAMQSNLNNKEKVLWRFQLIHQLVIYKIYQLL